MVQPTGTHTLDTLVSILAASHFCSVSPLDLSFRGGCFIQNGICCKLSKDISSNKPETVVYLYVVR